MVDLGQKRWKRFHLFYFVLRAKKKEQRRKSKEERAKKKEQRRKNKEERLLNIVLLDGNKREKNIDCWTYIYRQQQKRKENRI